MATTRTQGFEQGQARPDTVSDIIGLKVYTQSGVYVGTIDDMQLDFTKQQSTGIALTDVNPEIQKAVDDSARGVVIPYAWVQAVHDVVLTIDILERLDHTA